MISFLVSLIFVILCFPIWLVLGVLNGLLDGLLFLISKSFWVFEQNFLVEHQLPLSDSVVSIFVVPLMAIWKSIEGFFDPMCGLWAFSRDQNPVLMFLVCFVLMIVWSRCLHQLRR